MLERLGTLWWRVVRFGMEMGMEKDIEVWFFWRTIKGNKMGNPNFSTPNSVGVFEQQILRGSNGTKRKGQRASFCVIGGS